VDSSFRIDDIPSSSSVSYVRLSFSENARGFAVVFR
jgi:hypothetical protein